MTELEIVKKEQTYWSGEVYAVYEVGEYAIVEYEQIDFSSGPSHGTPTGKHLFGCFIDGRAIGRSTFCLDSALVTAIAYKHDGPNSQAAHFFMKMIENETRKDQL